MTFMWPLSSEPPSCGRFPSSLILTLSVVEWWGQAPWAFLHLEKRCVCVCVCVCVLVGMGPHICLWRYPLVCVPVCLCVSFCASPLCSCVSLFVFVCVCVCSFV